MSSASRARASVNLWVDGTVDYRIHDLFATPWSRKLFSDTVKCGDVLVYMIPLIVTPKFLTSK